LEKTVKNVVKRIPKTNSLKDY